MFAHATITEGASHATALQFLIVDATQLLIADVILSAHVAVTLIGEKPTLATVKAKHVIQTADAILMVFLAAHVNPRSSAAQTAHVFQSVYANMSVSVIVTLNGVHPIVLATITIYVIASGTALATAIQYANVTTIEIHIVIA